MIKAIPGHEGMLISIEDDEDLYGAIVIIRNQIENFDIGHPVLEQLNEIIDELE